METASAPPVIFSLTRRAALRRRAQQRKAFPNLPTFILDDMLDDVGERLAFLRHAPLHCLLIGAQGRIPLLPTVRSLSDLPSPPRLAFQELTDSFDEAQPLAGSGYDLIVSLGNLDTVNDLPGALIHLRNALAPGGLLIASFFGAGSLPALRAAMLAADGDRPAPRLHPMVDVRAGGQLLQRAGLADAVIDTRTLTARYRTLDGLVADLRTMGASNVLADPGPALSKAALARARAAFGEGTVEQFEIITLSGWKR